MHPIKNHRIVREGAAMVASGRDGRDAVIESAEDEGRLPERPHPMATYHASKDALAASPAFPPAVIAGK